MIITIAQSDHIFLPELLAKRSHIQTPNHHEFDPIEKQTVTVGKHLHTAEDNLIQEEMIL